LVTSTQDPFPRGIKAIKAIPLFQLNLWSVNRNTTNFIDPDVDNVSLALENQSRVAFQDSNVAHSFMTFSAGMVENTTLNEEFYLSRYYNTSTADGGGLTVWLEIIIL